MTTIDEMNPAKTYLRRTRSNSVDTGTKIIETSSKWDPSIFEDSMDYHHHHHHLHHYHHELSSTAPRRVGSNSITDVLALEGLMNSSLGQWKPFDDDDSQASTTDGNLLATTTSLEKPQRLMENSRARSAPAPDGRLLATTNFLEKPQRLAENSRARSDPSLAMADSFEPQIVTENSRSWSDPSLAMADTSEKPQILTENSRARSDPSLAAMADNSEIGKMGGNRRRHRSPRRTNTPSRRNLSATRKSGGSIALSPTRRNRSSRLPSNLTSSTNSSVPTLKAMGDPFAESSSLKKNWARGSTGCLLNNNDEENATTTTTTVDSHHQTILQKALADSKDKGATKSGSPRSGRRDRRGKSMPRNPPRMLSNPRCLSDGKLESKVSPELLQKVKKNSKSRRGANSDPNLLAKNDNLGHLSGGSSESMQNAKWQVTGKEESNTEITKTKRKTKRPDPKLGRSATTSCTESTKTKMGTEKGDATFERSATTGGTGNPKPKTKIRKEADDLLSTTKGKMKDFCRKSARSLSPKRKPTRVSELAEDDTTASPSNQKSGRRSSGRSLNHTRVRSLSPTRVRNLSASPTRVRRLSQTNPSSQVPQQQEESGRGRSPNRRRRIGVDAIKAASITNLLNDVSESQYGDELDENPHIPRSGSSPAELADHSAFGRSGSSPASLANYSADQEDKDIIKQKIKDLKQLMKEATDADKEAIELQIQVLKQLKKDTKKELKDMKKKEEEEKKEAKKELKRASNHVKQLKKQEEKEKKEAKKELKRASNNGNHLREQEEEETTSADDASFYPEVERCNVSSRLAGVMLKQRKFATTGSMTEGGLNAMYGAAPQESAQFGASVVINPDDDEKTIKKKIKNMEEMKKKEAKAELKRAKKEGKESKKLKDSKCVNTGVRSGEINSDRLVALRKIKM